MQQLWLIRAATVSESTTPLELDSRTHEELVVLMAVAIESTYLQQANSPQHAKEASTDEPTTTASQD